MPHSIFAADAGELQPNQLVIRLQPDEGMKLQLMTKEPGPGRHAPAPDPLDIELRRRPSARATPDAYERLLLDVVRGNPTLFMRRDEVEAAWRWVEPILDAWASAREAPRPYTAGTWGPTAAIALIERDGRTWHEDLG